MATEWIVGYPLITDNTTGISVIASGSLNQSGYLYSVILPSASGIPTSADVAAGAGSGNVAVPSGFADSAEVSDSGVVVSLSGYNLTSETDYVMYVVGSGYTDGIMADPSGLSFTTPDITAPSWSGAYPSVNEIYGTSGTFNLAVNESTCSGFVLVLASGSTEPTAAAIKASGTAAAMTTADTVYVVTVTGLASETAYSAYAVAQDEVPNLQSSGWLIGSFVTDDITAPEWATGYPSIGSITTSAAVMSFKLNDAGSGYFIIVPSGSATPSAAQIKAGTNASDVAIAAGLFGSTALVANTVATVNVSNLQYSTYYTVYAVGEDDYDNATSPAVVSTSFRAAVPRPGMPGRYSADRIAKDRQRATNAIRSSMM